MLMKMVRIQRRLRKKLLINLKKPGKKKDIIQKHQNLALVAPVEVILNKMKKTLSERLKKKVPKKL